MFYDQIHGDDCLLDIFEGDTSHIRFINSSPVLAILCEKARSSLKIVECNYPQGTQQVQVNINIDNFIYSTAITQCSEMIGAIAYACKTCRIIQAPIYLCYSCFQEGQHVKKKHETEIIQLPKQLVDKLQCHCGDKTLIKRNGTCSNHCSSRKQLDEFSNSADYLEFKQFIVDCFKIYFQLLDTREYFVKSSEIYKLSEYYESELMQCINNILYENNTQNIRFMSDCLSTFTTKKCGNGYYQKRSIIIHLLDNNLITSQFYHIFHQLVREDHFYLSSKVFSYIATSYIKLHIGISQKQNLDDNDSRQIKKKVYYLQDLLNQFVICADNSEIICNLAVKNQILNSQYLFNKAYRMIIMKLYCFLMKAIVINNKDTNRLEQFFKELNKHKLLCLFFIQQSCLPHFMLCSMSDENSFMQLLAEIQKSLALKKNQPNLNLVHYVCQVFLISHNRKINTVHKYLTKSKFPALLSLIKNSESNPNLKGQINQNLTNLCFNIRQILNNQNIVIQQLKKQQEQVENNLIIYQQINNTSQQTQIKAQKITQNLKNEQKNVTAIKQKIKTQKQIAIQKKKQKLHQKFATKGKNFLQKYKIQTKMVQQHMCGICRQQNQENKQLFMMGKIYNRNNNLSQIVKINKTQKYIDVCKHTFHVQCILKSHKANNSLQSKCPLCKQSINIGFLIQDQQLTEKGEVQFIQLLNLSKQLQDKQTYTLFPDLLLGVIQEKYQQIIFKVDCQQKVEKQSTKANQLQMKQSKNQLVFQIVLKTLRQLYSRFNKKNRLQIQQIIIKNCEISPQKNLCLNKIFDILLLGTFASIRKAQHLFQKIIVQLSQLYQILQSREVQKIILSLPKIIIEIINSRKNIIKNIGTSNKKICDYLYNLPKNIAQFYNNFKPACNKTRLHYKNYCYCLICDQIYCSECKQKQAQHKRSHSNKKNFVYKTLILSTGQLNVHMNQKIKTYKIYMSSNNKLNNIQNQLKQFDNRLYVSIVQELVKSLKIRTGN